MTSSAAGGGPVTFRVVVMGIAGSGKSSVGRSLAQRLALPFIEGDDLHPASNVARMTAALPLTDADRWPWLEAVAAALRDAPKGAVVSCSALKRSYRDYLRSEAGGPITFVYLQAGRELLSRRLVTRKGHFMKQSMLDSQIEALETPVDEPDVLTLDASASIDSIVLTALLRL